MPHDLTAEQRAHFESLIRRNLSRYLTDVDAGPVAIVNLIAASNAFLDRDDQLLADERERIAHEIALRIEQTPAEEWGQPLHVGDTPEQGFYNGANAAIRFAASIARGQA